MEDKKQRIMLSALDAYSYDAVKASEVRTRGADYISWGDNNLYPDYLYSLYSNCATLQSIINGSVDYTYGDGLQLGVLPTSLNPENSQGQTLDDVIHNLIADYWIFGGFAFQVIKNTFGDVTEIAYIDFKQLRTDFKGDYIFYSDKYGGYGSRKAEKFEKFDPDGDSSIQIYYFKGNKTRGVYPVPDYSAAIVSAETQIEIQNFHYNTIKNNFAINGVLNMNGGVPLEDDMKIIEDKINKKFSGSSNAGRLFISWNADKEQATTFERLSDDTFDQKYTALAESTRDNIFISMRAIPVLFGSIVQTGFNTQEYQEAFKLYNKTAIIPKQKDIERVFAKVLGENSITFKPFNIEVSNEG